MKIHRRVGHEINGLHDIEVRSLEMVLGHLMRMETSRWPKRIIEYIMAKDRRRSWRPRKAWIEDKQIEMAAKVLD